MQKRVVVEKFQKIQDPMLPAFRDVYLEFGQLQQFGHCVNVKGSPAAFPYVFYVLALKAALDATRTRHDVMATRARGLTEIYIVPATEIVKWSVQFLHYKNNKNRRNRVKKYIKQAHRCGILAGFTQKVDKEGVEQWSLTIERPESCLHEKYLKLVKEFGLDETFQHRDGLAKVARLLNVQPFSGLVPPKPRARARQWALWGHRCLRAHIRAPLCGAVDGGHAGERRERSRDLRRKQDAITRSGGRLIRRGEDPSTVEEHVKDRYKIAVEGENGGNYREAFNTLQRGARTQGDFLGVCERTIRRDNAALLKDEKSPVLLKPDYIYHTRVPLPGGPALGAAIKKYATKKEGEPPVRILPAGTATIDGRERKIFHVVTQLPYRMKYRLRCDNWRFGSVPPEWHLDLTNPNRTFNPGYTYGVTWKDKDVPIPTRSRLTRLPGCISQPPYRLAGLPAPLWRMQGGLLPPSLKKTTTDLTELVGGCWRDVTSRRQKGRQRNVRFFPDYRGPLNGQAKPTTSTVKLDLTGIEDGIKEDLNQQRLSRRFRIRLLTGKSRSFSYST